LAVVDWLCFKAVFDEEPDGNEPDRLASQEPFGGFGVRIRKGDDVIGGCLRFLADGEGREERKPLPKLLCPLFCVGERAAQVRDALCFSF